MYYFFYSCHDQRNRYSFYRKKPTKFNKFDIDWIYSGIRRRYKIYDDKTAEPGIVEIIRQYKLMDLPRLCFTLEVADPTDAMWVKLNADNLTKNNDRYGMVYHGSIGPIDDGTTTSLNEVIMALNTYKEYHNNYLRYCNRITHNFQFFWPSDAEVTLRKDVPFDDKDSMIQERLKSMKSHILKAQKECDELKKIISKKVVAQENEFIEKTEAFKRELNSILGL